MTLIYTVLCFTVLPMYVHTTYTVLYTDVYNAEEVEIKRLALYCLGLTPVDQTSPIARSVEYLNHKHYSTAQFKFVALL